MNKTFYFIFCIFFLLNACSTMEPQTMSSKNARTIPTWVNTRPQDPDYYIGIGTASKNNSNSESYMALAKKNALADLASEISIQIESRSILNTLQTGHDFSQQFTNQIKAENSIKLEGYEQMGTWENSDYYWIYYRLSKKAYEQWKIRQKEAAVSQARNQYLQAKKMIENKLYINALKLYIEALTSLESYLNETTLCELNQQQADLGITIYNDLIQLINESKIIIPQQPWSVKKGLPLNIPLCFDLKYQQQTPMENIPIKINYSGKNILKSSVTTDYSGHFCIDLEKISSTKNQEMITMGLDITALSRFTSSHIIRQMIKTISTTKTILPLHIEKPNIFITGTERTLKDSIYTHQLKDYFGRQLLTDFNCTPDSMADCILNIETFPIFKKSYYNLNSVGIDLDCQITLSDKTGQILYTRRLHDEYLGATREAALENGYNAITKSFDRFIKSEIIRCLE